MDVSKASYYIQENNKNKVTSGMGLTKKKYLKKCQMGNTKKNLDHQVTQIHQHYE
jgi:hypothetical protein